MNTTKFVYNGIELDLDVDDFAVDQRVEQAIKAGIEDIKTLAGSGGPMQVVDRIKITLNEAFGREDAAELLLGKVTRLSAFMESFYRICGIIGKMRSMAMDQAAATIESAGATADAKKKKK